MSNGMPHPPTHRPANPGRVEFGDGFLHDEPVDDPLEPGADLVSVRELIELSGKAHKTVTTQLAELRAPVKRTRRGFVVPLAWAKAHVRELLA